MLIQTSGKKGISVCETGIRPGEKLHEILISNFESQVSYQFDDSYYVILGTHPSQELQRQYAHLPRVPFKSYQSSDISMNQTQIQSLLQRGGFL